MPLDILTRVTGQLVAEVLMVEDCTHTSQRVHVSMRLGLKKKSRLPARALTRFHCLKFVSFLLNQWVLFIKNTIAQKSRSHSLRYHSSLI
jgi:hypothetical protein